MLKVRSVRAAKQLPPKDKIELAGDMSSSCEADDQLTQGSVAPVVSFAPQAASRSGAFRPERAAF